MNQPDPAEIEKPDAMERVVQEAIEEWATIHGGPRPDDVPLAHYITAKVRHALTGWRTDPEAAAALRQPREGAEGESSREERYREALEELSAYTATLWYGTTLREGSQAQTIVRHVRGILGAALSEEA